MVSATADGDVMCSDNSTALLLVTLIVTILNTASSETEKLVLYRFLAEASADVPEVVSMA
jgi:neurofibromin 1